MLFRDRRAAGRELATRLLHYANRTDVVVLALPRGGVPVGFEVAEALSAPLDVFLVRKLGVPGQVELAMGAIASGGIRVLNDEVIQKLQPTAAMIAAAEVKERRELERREREYRGGQPMPNVKGKIVILVDDGLATGSTMRAAIAAIRRLRPARVVLAVPVGAAETCKELLQEADDVICLQEPEPFSGVGKWYDDFSQITDDEVRELLHRSESIRAP